MSLTALSGLSGLSAVCGGVLPPVPAEATGQSLVWQEGFGAGSAAGVFSSADWTDLSGGLSAGSLIGGLRRGPTWLDAGTGARRTGSAAAKWFRTSVHSAGTMWGFASSRTFTAGARSLGVLSLWLRPIGHFGGGTTQTILEVRHTSGSAWLSLQLKEDGTTGLPYLALNAPGWSADAVTLLDPDAWVQIWIAYQAGGDGTSELWIRTTDGGTPIRVGTGFWQPYGNVADTVVIGFVGAANQPPFAGRIALMELRSADTLAHARVGPTAYLWPDETVRATVTVDPATGDDANYTGTVATLSRVGQLIDACVLVGDQYPYTVGGAKKRLADYADPDAMDGFAAAVVAGTVAARGDRFALAAGDHDAPAQWWDLPAPGVEWVCQSGSTVYGSTELDDNWSQPDAGTYPKVWKYDGSTAVYRACYTADGRGFAPLFGLGGTANATVYAALNGGDWRQWTSSGGVVYISLPTGSTPTSVGPLRGTGSTTSPNVDGMMIRDYRGDQWLVPDYQAADTNVMRQVNPLMQGGTYDHKPITVVIDPVVSNFGRKAFGWALANESLTVVVNPILTLCPPPSSDLGSGVTLGVNNGAFVHTTDQPVDTTTTALDPGLAVSYYVLTDSDPGAAAQSLPGSATGQAFQSGYAWAYLSHGVGGATKGMARTTLVNPISGTIVNGSACPAVGTTTALDTHVEFVVE